ncbi:MAG: arginine repressor, partial [Proteobacteria bacterium]|nr:arginine repressor [Pseudomonadota bacterium]
LKTGPGNANRAGVIIDRASIPGILGTIAGDDTIFVAVANRHQQAKVLRRIFALFD